MTFKKKHIVPFCDNNSTVIYFIWYIVTHGGHIMLSITNDKYFLIIFDDVTWST